MSSTVGFQIAIELSNVFPLRDLARYTATQVLDFARKLRVSGSDIVVEEDLAAIFGRGRISLGLEQKFKEAVKSRKITAISTGSEDVLESEVVLDSGPGPTVLRGFQDRYYLSTVITLSMLGYFHNREQFATMLAALLTKRYEMGISQTSSSPGYEGIVNTLAACSSQTSAFAWSHYSQLAQEKLRTSIPGYEHSSKYILISPSLMLGAMDYLYLVQRLPEDRKINVSNQSGCITLILWAHYLLGLTVVITASSFPPITFGSSQDPHILIFWTRDWASSLHPEEPVIRLLQKDKVVLSESGPEQEPTLSMEAEERHPLCGWGTIYLRRVFNNSIVTPDNSPMYEESVKLVTALAIHVSSRLDRDMDSNEDMEADEVDKLPQRKIYLEAWRVLDVSKLLFRDLKVDAAGVETYLTCLGESILDENSCPVSFTKFLKKINPSTPFTSTRSFLRQVKYLARVILILSHIIDVEKCAEMPLLLTNTIHELEVPAAEVLSGTDKRSKIRVFDIFNGVVKLLSSTVLDPHNPRRDFGNSQARSYYLYSDYGWSVFLSSVAERDPAEIRPELVFVRKGTPTNYRTKERRFRIADGHNKIAGLPPLTDAVERGALYLPRATATVVKCQQYWSTHLQEFEMCLCLSVQPLQELIELGDGPYLDTTSFHYMHYCLSQTYSTTCCDHATDTAHKVTDPVKLGPEAVALLAWSNLKETIGDNWWPERILIMLTRGQPHIRWLAITMAGMGRQLAPRNRQIMLRTEDCCDNCAFEDNR